MATLSDRLPQNVPGRYYVDSSCIDCDRCRADAPGFFLRDGNIGMSVVFQQPQTVEEMQLAQNALEGCPTESIGNDGA